MHGLAYSHFGPVKEGMHEHLYWLTGTLLFAPVESVHVPLFRHGDDAHSSTSTSPRAPAYPIAFVQLYALGGIV